jgi:hypothetical protein
MISPSLQASVAGGFARELKFVIPRSLADEIHRWARTWLAPDPHGDQYRVSSVYFDTAEFDVLHRNGSFARGKYRVRRYGSSPGVFLERKLKAGGRVGKKRTEVSIEELPQIVQAEPNRNWAGYWYHRRLLVRRLQPTCHIAYSRTARVGATAKGTIRLTMDDDVVATPVQCVGFEHVGNPSAVAVGGVILELKFRERPELFQQLIERFKLEPQTASKYRSACATLGLGVLQHA